MRTIQSLAELPRDLDAIVLDQWGVLHDGSTPYHGVPETLQTLSDRGVRLAVLSNSGKRAALNSERIASMGYPSQLFSCVMTSGEALWRDIADGRLDHLEKLYPITAKKDDALAWADGLAKFDFVDAPDEADAILLMGLADTSDHQEERAVLEQALIMDVPLICSNPDRSSPRRDGALVTSPGALAHDYMTKGGKVIFYGKPHRPVFDSIARQLEARPDRLLMVGDSLEHDIKGGASAGWKTLFVKGGVHADQIGETEERQDIEDLARQLKAPLPDYTIDLLR